MTEERRSGDFSPAEAEEVDDSFGWDSQDWGTAEEKSTLSSSAANIDEYPTGPLPTIDQWPTQPIPVLADEPFSFQQRSFVDDESIAEIDSLLQPALERIAETGPHPAIRQTGPQPAVQQTTGAGNYMVQARTLAKSSGIYALASLSSPLVSLVLSPFLAHRLSPTSYGILAVLTTAIGLAAGITQLGLGSAFFRVYNYEVNDQSARRSVLATVTLLLGLVSIPVAMLVALFAPTLAGVLLQSQSLNSFVILAVGVVLVQNLTVPGFAWLRAESRPLFFSILSICNVLIVLGLNLLLVGLLRWGVAGSLFATGSGYAFVALCTLPLLLWRSRLKVRKDIAWSLLTFGGPQVFSYISVWVLQLSDRYLLSLMVSLAQAASYAVAYSLGAVLSTLVIAPFSLAWPAMMYSVAKHKDAAYIFQVVFRWFSIVLLFVAFAVSIGGSLLLDLLFPKSYHSAAPIIPVVAESIVFYGLYIIFMTGASVRRKTWMPAVFTTVAAVANVGLNLVLIPLYASAGAAASTLIAYIVLALVAYFANQRIYPVPYEMKRFWLALASGVVLYVGADALSLVLKGFWHWPLTLVCLALYGICLLYLGGGMGLLKAGSARLMKRIAVDRRGL
jgi:O-antigen/teichoic acid export membrane protein